MHARITISLLASCLLTPCLRADDLGGGMSGSHGRVPRLVLESWLPGEPSAFRFSDLPPGNSSLILLVSDRSSSLALPGIGTLVVDTTRPSFVAVPVPALLPIPKLPAALNGASLVFQGLYLDRGRYLLTDGTRADVFTPEALVTNQSDSTLSAIDLHSARTTQLLPNVSGGHVTFSPDRRFAYVCEPGRARNQVVFFDLTKTPIQRLGAAKVSGWVRYGCAVSPDGKRLYAPCDFGISIIDSDPTSKTFMTEQRTVLTLIAGIPYYILTGPLDLALTPDGKKLYIGYGELTTYPARSNVGVIDLTKPNYPERLIPITTGGSFAPGQGIEYATHSRIQVSADGLFVYVCEWGIDPSISPTVVRGFRNGGLVNVIATRIDREIAAIPTGGFGATDFAADRLGRNLWVAQQGSRGIGEVVRIDTDRRSPNRWTRAATIRIDPTPYAPSYGPRGIGVTPDGASVLVAVADDVNHPIPQVMRIDARTNNLVAGATTVVGRLCASVSIQQR